jgi:multidrug efflux pump
MGGLYVNQFNEFGFTWQVQVEAAPDFRTSATMLKQFQVRTSQGEMVPLGSIAQVRDATTPLIVMRYNTYASAAINGTPAPNVSTGTMINEIARMAKEMDIPFEWTQMTYLEVQAGNVALLIFALGTLLVYFVLAAKYESWRLPLAVILVVPLCMLAAIAGMTIARLPVDIFVQIGLLVLVGLASKNAILIVEFARDQRLAGKDLHESALAASKTRFRPIIMTSFAFIFGVLPLVLATGAGAEMRQSLGTAVFSGMIGVTLFGIFLTPVFFFGLMWFGRQSQVPAQPAADKIGSPASTERGDGDGKVASPTPEAHPLPPM